MALLSKKLSLLVVAESTTLGEIIETIFSKTNSVVISGEASGGGQALDMLNRLSPDVVLLDMDLPQGDSLRVLRDVMAQQATPVIVISTLSGQGLHRAFCALTSGAVDFVGREALVENAGSSTFAQEIVDKVISASRVDVSSFDSLVKPGEDNSAPGEKKSEIVFCEDCGARNVFQLSLEKQSALRHCAQCGDLLEPHLTHQHKRAHYVTVIAAGSGSYANLVKIIPRVDPGLRGAIIIVLYDQPGHVDVFGEYLDACCAVDVVRMRSDLSIEGGRCYLAAAAENFYMKPYSTGNTIKRAGDTAGDTPVDLLMQSVSEVFKKNSAGLILSGTELDGEKGLRGITDNGGVSALLFSANCLHRQMGENVLRRCKIDKIVDENDAITFITELHNAARDSVSTA